MSNILKIYLFWQKLFFHVVTKGVHIWHNDCLWFVDLNIYLRSSIRLWSQRSNIFYICLTTLYANSTFIFP